MRSTEVAARDALAGKAASRYWRANRWAEHAELKQVAWLALLEADRTFNAAVGVPWQAYGWRAAVLAVRDFVLRARCPVHTRAHAAAGAHDVPRGVTLGEEPPCSATQLDALASARLGVRIAEAVYAEIAAHPDAELGVAVLFDEHAPADVAAANGVAVAKVYKAARQLRQALMFDARLYEAWLES